MKLKRMERRTKRRVMKSRRMERRTNRRGMKGGEFYGGDCCNEQVTETKELLDIGLVNAAKSAGAEAVVINGAKFYKVKIYGDGHCMYRSVGAALNPEVAALKRNKFGVINDTDAFKLEEAAAMSLRWSCHTRSASTAAPASRCTSNRQAQVSCTRPAGASCSQI